MSRYELWAAGNRLAKYKTLAQALLGAVWRAKKLKLSVYVYTTGLKNGRCVACIDVV
jgi:hypothetical protein